MAKRSKKAMIISEVTFLVVVAAVLAVTMFFCERIELAMGLKYYEEVPIDAVPNAEASAMRAAGELKVHFVDVGQGDCTLIELPDGKTMIIDGGENNKATESAIKTYIDDNFGSDFKYFDYAILTHPDSDHCGSMDYVLGEYPARVSYRPNVEANNKGYADPGKAELTANAKTKDTVAYKNCIDAMYKKVADFTPIVHVTSASEQQIIYGGAGDDLYTFDFYSPLSDTYTDWNDYSPIMILNYRGYRFALSGDAEKKNEEEFVAKVNAAKTDGVTDKYDEFTDDYTVNVIKAGHHGSRTSTSQAYIDVITTPDGARDAYYVISCGEGNSYGHPHAETLTRFEDMGVPQENVLRTDVSGDISLSVKADAQGFALYCGETKTSAQAGSLPKLPEDLPEPPEELPVPPEELPEPPEELPEPPEELPEPPQDTETVRILVYRKIGNVDLTWPLVAWCGYGVLVAVTAVQLVFTTLGTGDGRRKK